MNSIYMINFGGYHAEHYCYLISERVGKSPFVKVRRQFGDLPFWQYYKMRLYYKIARWFRLRADGIEYCIKITSGMEKDIVWRKREDGMYEPYDKICDISMPYLARKTPPTQKHIRKGFIVDTGKSKTRNEYTP